MSNNNSFVPLIAAMLIGCGGAAGWTGYQFVTDTKMDAYYLSESTTLRSAALQAVYLSNGAATDSALIPDLERLEATIDKSISTMQIGDPVTGVAPPPAAVAAQIANVRAAWDAAAPSIAKIIGSMSETDSFTRSRVEVATAVDTSLSSIRSAAQKLEGVPGVTAKQKEQVAEAVTLMDDAATLLHSAPTINAQTLRSIDASISSFLGAVTATANQLPRDKPMMDEVIKSYRSAQSAQRLLAKTIAAASGAVQNLPHAKEVWAARDSIDNATAALISSVQSMPQGRLASPFLIAVLGGLTIGLSLLSFLFVIRNASTRASIAESRGNTIMGSQKERSKELNLLLSDISRVGDGDFDHVMTEDKESTKEIAKLLTGVFTNIREILQEANHTITGLAAATEQALVTAKNVDRNRQEQTRSIEHISALIVDMSTYIDVIETMTYSTQKVALDVSVQVGAATGSVREVHEGIQLLVQHNIGIQHRSKHLIESFQSLERISIVVDRVANNASLVAYNAWLISDKIEADSEISRALTKSGEAMKELSTEASSAVTEIDQLLKTMNEAARDIQSAVDSTQRESETVNIRSDVALNALNDISKLTGSLSESVNDVTNRTTNLKIQFSEVRQTMESILHYSSENSLASDQTAGAITSVNRQSQELQRLIQAVMKKK